jgi:hypothetical protein
MGVDVLLYVEVDAEPDGLDVISSTFRSRAPGWVWEYGGLTYEAHDWLATPRVDASSSMRFFGPGYERGSWPTILRAIGTLVELFPGRKVFYGGDTGDDGEECTPELIAELTAHYFRWCGAGAPSYHDRTHPFNREATDG